MSGGTLGGAGTVTVNGPTTWTSGSMIGSGATILNGNTTMSGSGSKSLVTRTLTNNATLTWSGGTFSVYEGAVINNAAAAVIDITTDSDISFFSGAVGTLNNDGLVKKTAGTLDTEIALVLANNATDAAKGIKVSSGELSFTRSVTNSGLFDSQGAILELTSTFTNFNDATDTLTGGQYKVSGGGTFKFVNADIDVLAANIELDGATSRIVNQSNVGAFGGFVSTTSAGALTIQNGHNLTTPGAFSNSGNMTMGSSSTLTTTMGYTQSSGTTHLAAASAKLTTLSGIVDINGGQLTGIGTVEQATQNAGTVKPGLSPGIMSVSGNYVQGASGTYEPEIAGTSAGTGYDRLDISGAATLNGTLSIVTVSPFAPTAGDSFQVMTFASSTGQFSQVQGGNLGNGKSYSVSYNPTNVTLTVVAINDCTRTGSTMTITLAPAGQATIARSGDNFSVTAADISDPTCSGATVNNIDTINVNGSTGAETAVIDLSGGTFSPGATAEGTGTSEIEFNADLGSGSDTVVVQGGSTDEFLDVTGSGVKLNNDTDTDVLNTNVEALSVKGGAGNDTIKGAPGAESLFGEAGNDSVVGGGGTDTADGGSGNDLVSGGAQADIVSGGEGDDSVLGRTGSDDVNGDDGNDSLSPGGQAVNDALDGGPGRDTADYGRSPVGTSNQGVTVDLAIVGDGSVGGSGDQDTTVAGIGRRQVDRIPKGIVLRRHAQR